MRIYYSEKLNRLLILGPPIVGLPKKRKWVYFAKTTWDYVGEL